MPCSPIDVLDAEGGVGRNLDPQNPEEWDDATREHQWRSTFDGDSRPIRQDPQHHEDRLVGAVDVAASYPAAARCFNPAAGGCPPWCSLR